MKKNMEERIREIERRQKRILERLKALEMATSWDLVDCSGYEDEDETDQI